jgi:hypothetical protein
MDANRPPITTPARTPGSLPVEPNRRPVACPGRRQHTPGSAHRYTRTGRPTDQSGEPGFEGGELTGRRPATLARTNRPQLLVLPVSVRSKRRAQPDLGCPSGGILAAVLGVGLLAVRHTEQQALLLRAARLTPPGALAGRAAAQPARALIGVLTCLSRTAAVGRSRRACAVDWVAGHGEPDSAAASVDGQPDMRPRAAASRARAATRAKSPVRSASWGVNQEPPTHPTFGRER